MARNLYWQDTSQNINTSANFVDDNGVNYLPAQGDALFFMKGSKVINQNMNAFSSTDFTIGTGPGFTGSLGDSSNPFECDNCTVIRINSPIAGEIHLAPTTVDNLYVEDCSNAVNGCHLQDGIYTNVFIQRGQVKGGNGSEVNNLVVSMKTNRNSDARFVMELGFTIDDIRQLGGYIESYGVLSFNSSAAAGIRSLVINGGTFVHRADANALTYGADIATLEMSGDNSNFQFVSTGGTIDSFIQYGGYFSVSGGPAEQIRTINTLDVHPGSIANLQGGNGMVHIGTLTSRGGQILGVAGSDYSVGGDGIPL